MKNNLTKHVQEIIKELDVIIKNKEQVNGFQEYDIPTNEMDGKDWEKRDRKIFFDGFEDGRNMMKIDLMNFKSHLLLSQLKTIELLKEELEGMKVAGGNYNCGEEGCCPPPKNEIEKEDVEVQMGYNHALSQAITLLDTIIQDVKLQVNFPQKTR